MANNLSLHLSQAQVRALRDNLDLLVDDFAKEHGLHPSRVRLELGYIAAHFAASAGVLDGAYKEWIDARRAETAGTGGADQGRVGPPDGGNGAQGG